MNKKNRPWEIVPHGLSDFPEIRLADRDSAKKLAQWVADQCDVQVHIYSEGYHTEFKTLEDLK